MDSESSERSLKCFESAQVPTGGTCTAARLLARARLQPGGVPLPLLRLQHHREAKTETENQIDIHGIRLNSS